MEEGAFGISMRNKENIELPSRPIDTKAVGEQAIIFWEDCKESSILRWEFCCRARRWREHLRKRMRMQNILDEWPRDPRAQWKVFRGWGVAANRVRKGEIEAEWGLELGNEDDLGGCMHRAKGPSKIQPDGPKAESHGAATSVQKRRSVTSCPEHDTWASHSALPKVAWSPAGIGAGSSSECKSSCSWLLWTERSFGEQSVFLLRLSGHTSPYQSQH